MDSLESLAAAWEARVWLALLAFTAAALVVAALRKPCRRWFGAECAFQLWLLPPLALLASQLPHVAASTAQLPPLVYRITSVVGATAPHADATGSFDWRILASLLWLIGAVIVLTLAIVAQRRYRLRLRGATLMTGASASRPVLRAASADIGPALVGTWRSRIVLPADFCQRYDATEQVLILAHESMHARRHDGWWCLFAQMHVVLLWCHPLAWWALAALRRDQELACDAVVLREHGAQRRSYANAMLKTQSAAFVLPVGCTWSPRHPLTERIAMLKQQPISILRQRSGGVILTLVIAMGTGVAYAATTPAEAHANPTFTPDRYTLKLDVSLDGKPADRHLSLCLKPGEYENVSELSKGMPPLKGRVAVLPAAKGQIEVRSDFSGGGLGKEVRPIVRILPGQPASIMIGRSTVDQHASGQVSGRWTGIKLDMTTTIGC